MGSSSGSMSSSSGAGGEDAVMQQRQQMLFQSQERFQVSGKIANVAADKGEITIQRQGLPPALLRVEPQTKVQVDGRQASLDQLRPGEDVRASFNLSGRRPIALEVNASQCGSCSSGSSSSGSGSSWGGSSSGSSGSSSPSTNPTR
jgi:hypothetical protein